MKIIKGFQADIISNYQLNVVYLIKHAIRNYSRQEIVSRNLDGSLFRYTYSDAYKRMQRLANSLKSIGVQVGDRIGVIAWNTKNYNVLETMDNYGKIYIL
ncbi:unnamed protein product [marine sediment metagenome]|uniref:AMP-dependent synthetase/ligase domain-containing protein n=1 Tax=marine sediment metagenome TaxID=412755 RepID=X1I297_9ZZZZ